MKAITQYIDEKLTLNNQSKLASNNNIFKLFNNAKQDCHYMNHPDATNYKKVVYNNVSIFFPDWEEYDHMKVLCDIFEIIIDNNKDILKDCSFICSDLLYPNLALKKEMKIKFNLYAPSWDRNFDRESLQDAYLTNIIFYFDNFSNEDLINGKGVYCDKQYAKYLRGTKRKIFNAIRNYIGSLYSYFEHK